MTTSGDRLKPPLVEALDQVERAADVLRDPGGIHEARRALKRARALEGLCLGGDHESRVRASQNLLRDAGRRLSEARDREAAAELVESTEPAAALPAEVVQEVTEQARTGGATGDERRRIRHALQAEAGELRKLSRKVSNRDIMEQLETSYRRCRERARDAAGAPTANALHSLRKAAKVLRYQLEWLSPAWPTILGAWATELHVLTDELGHTTDVAVLRHTLADGTGAEARPQVAEALGAIHREVLENRRSALRRSERLFAEKPGAFRKRMARIAGGVLPDA